MQLRYDASQHDTIMLKAVDTVPVTAAPAAQAKGSIGRALRWPIKNLGYCLVVVVPTLISILYFAFIAADRYEVETETAPQFRTVR